MKRLIPLFVLMSILFLSINIQAQASTNSTLSQEVKKSFNPDTNETKSFDDIRQEVYENKEKFSLEGSLEKIQDSRIPILIGVGVISLFLFFLGWLVPNLKIKAWSLIGIALVSYICLSFPYHIIGGIMAIIDWIVQMFFPEG